jgi:hypothetical protein
MFSIDGGVTFGNKVSFDRSCEPMSVSFGQRMQVLATPAADGSTSTIVERLAVTWTGLDNQVNLLSLPFDPQAPFKGRATFERSEDCGPAVTHIGVRLHFLWQGTDNRLNGVTSTDGASFVHKRTLPTESPDDASPAIAYVNGRAVLTYIGTDRQINMMSSQNGIDWVNKITLGEEAEEESTVAIAPTDNSGGCAIAWTGTDSDHHINVMQLAVNPTTGVIAPGAKVVLNESSATDAGPALAFGSGVLHLAWTGRDGMLNLMFSFDGGRTFHRKRVLSEASRDDCGPALTVRESGTPEVPDLVVIGWTGTG